VKTIVGFIVVSMLAVFQSVNPAWSGDLDDGISEYTEEPIAADDRIGKKDTNINFIVVDAIAKAKMAEKDDDEEKGDEKDSGEKKTISNINDGTNENNENSVVVEPGSKVDSIYNIIIEK